MGKVKGFVMGALLGTAGALLLAPKSGKELREDIKNAIENNDWFNFDIEYIDSDEIQEAIQDALDNKEAENNEGKEDIIIDLKHDDQDHK